MRVWKVRTARKVVRIEVTRVGWIAPLCVSFCRGNIYVRHDRCA